MQFARKPANKQYAFSINPQKFFKNPQNIDFSTTINMSAMWLFNNSCAFADIFRNTIIEDDLARLSATCSGLRALLKPTTGFPGEACMDYSIQALFNNGKHIIDALASGIIPCQKTISFILETQTLGKEFFSFPAIVKGYVSTERFWKSITNRKIMDGHLASGFLEVGQTYTIPTATGYTDCVLVSMYKWNHYHHVVKKPKNDSDSDSDSDSEEFGDGEDDARWYSRMQDTKRKMRARGY